MYILKCEQCGCEYEHYSMFRRFCDDCRRQRDAERQRKKYQKNKVETDKKQSVKSISQIARELDEYNRKNGTCLTYGKYCEIMRCD